MRSQTYLSPQRLMRQLKPRWRRKTPLSHTWLRQKWPRRSPSVTDKQGFYSVEFESGKVPRLLLLNRPASLFDAADFTAVPHFLFDRSCGTSLVGGARRAVCTLARLCGDGLWREIAERFIVYLSCQSKLFGLSLVLMSLIFMSISDQLWSDQVTYLTWPKHKQTRWATYLFTV